MPAKAAVAVGTEIESQCGRCHDATQHVVLTVEKGKARKCRCKVCDAEHLYRKPKGPEDVRSRRKTGEARAAADAQAAYKKAMQAAGDGAAAAYAPSGEFTPGQKIKHKAFGEGVVLAVPRPRVAEVIFEDGVRRLAMNR